MLGASAKSGGCSGRVISTCSSALIGPCERPMMVLFYPVSTVQAAFCDARSAGLIPIWFVPRKSEIDGWMFDSAAIASILVPGGKKVLLFEFLLSVLW